LNWKKRTLKTIGEFAYAVVAAVIIRLYVFETMLVPTPSMVPTIQIGDRLFVEKITYTTREPKIGEIVVFWSPTPDERAQMMLRLFDKFIDMFSPRKFKGHVKLVKRIVGKEGDALEIKKASDGKYHLYVNGKIPEPLKDIEYLPDGIFKYPQLLDWLYKASLVREDPKKYTDLLIEIANESGEAEKFLRDLFAPTIRYFIQKEGENGVDEFIKRVVAFPSSDLVLLMRRVGVKVDRLAYILQDAKKLVESSSEYSIEDISAPFLVFSIVGGKTDLTGDKFYPGQPFKEYYEEYLSKLDLSKYIYRKGDHIVVKIPKGFFFFMGDNTRESIDSRFFGFVPKENVIGWPILRIWPLDRFGPVQVHTIQKK
jgi:signal peptidase I